MSKYHEQNAKMAELCNKIKRGKKEPWDLSEHFMTPNRKLITSNMGMIEISWGRGIFNEFLYGVTFKDHSDLNHAFVSWESVEAYLKKCSVEFKEEE